MLIAVVVADAAGVGGCLFCVCVVVGGVVVVVFS